MALIPDNFAQIIPSIAPWIEGLGSNPTAIALQNLFAQIEVFHILGLFVIGTAVILTGLRLMGVGLVEATPSSVYRNTRIWLHVGVVLVIVSGLLMGLSNASKLYDNSAFLWKMIAMVAAIIYSYAVMAPVAKADGRVTGGAKAGLIVGTIVWALAILVMLTKQGANVGVFHVLFAGVLIAVAAVSGRLRWVVLIGAAALFLILQVVTHGLIKDPFTEAWMTANKIWMWVFGLFVVGMMLLNILGRSAGPGSTALTRFVGYSTILVWVMTAAGGRWIGLT